MGGFIRDLNAKLEVIKKNFKEEKNVAAFTKEFVNIQTLVYKYEHYLNKINENKICYSEIL